jgi:hypothetical protein
MELVQWIAGSALLLVASVFITSNWVALLRRLRDPAHEVFMAPVVGGVLAAAGFAVIPVAVLREYWYVGFFLDYACFWGVSGFLVVSMFDLVGQFRGGRSKRR